MTAGLGGNDSSRAFIRVNSPIPRLGLEHELELRCCLHAIEHASDIAKTLADFRPFRLTRPQTRRRFRLSRGIRAGSRNLVD